MKTALVIGAAVLASLLVVGLLQVAVARWARRRAARMMAEHYADRVIELEDPLANGLGRESLGHRQVRGNGLLFLTPEALVFHPLVGGDPYEIPRDDIIAVEAPRVHLGKTRFRPLLAVRYRTEDGEDLAAWDLRQRERWVTELRKGLMDENEFWRILGLFDWSKTGDDGKVMARATDELVARPVEDLERFEDILGEKLRALDTRAHHDACAEKAGEPDGVSGDLFLYVRCVVVANGRQTFDSILADPSQMPGDLEFESLLAIARRAYEIKTGEVWDYVSPVSYESFENEAEWPDDDD